MSSIKYQVERERVSGRERNIERETATETEHLRNLYLIVIQLQFNMPKESPSILLSFVGETDISLFSLIAERIKLLVRVKQDTRRSSIRWLLGSFYPGGVCAYVGWTVLQRECVTTGRGSDIKRCHNCMRGCHLCAKCKYNRKALVILLVVLVHV